MTREKIIDTLYDIKNEGNWDYGETIEEVITNAIHFLQDQEYSEDCVNRKMVKEILTKQWTKNMPMELVNHLSSVLEKIDELPSVVPLRRVNDVTDDNVISAFIEFMYGDGEVDLDEVNTFMEMVYEKESGAEDGNN